MDVLVLLDQGSQDEEVIFSFPQEAVLAPVELPIEDRNRPIQLRLRSD